MTKKGKVTIFEDNTERVENRTMVLHFNYIFTHDQHDHTEPTYIDLKFANNRTVILK